MPTLCRRTSTHAALSRGQIGAVRVAALRRELRALGCDRFATEAAVSVAVSWVTDVLTDVAHAHADPPLADALRTEATAVLAAARRSGPPARRPAVREPAPPTAAHDEGPRPALRLTEREVVVLRRLQGDQSLREIGADLYVSVNTVKSHVRSIYRKFDVTSRDEAIGRARGLRLL